MKWSGVIKKISLHSVFFLTGYEKKKEKKKKKNEKKKKK